MEETGDRRSIARAIVQRHWARHGARARANRAGQADPGKSFCARGAEAIIGDAPTVIGRRILDLHEALGNAFAVELRHFLPEPTASPSYRSLRSLGAGVRRRCSPAQHLRCADN
jgi:hypothetical protein